jgi:hypothetical protein
MVRKPSSETKADAQRRLTSEMLNLDKRIDQQLPGSPERLELLREQANLSDEREALHSKRR